jgi:hypothetical protein
MMTLSKSFFGASCLNRLFLIPYPGSKLLLAPVGKLLERIKQQMLRLPLQQQRMYLSRRRVYLLLHRGHIIFLNLMQRSQSMRMSKVQRL